MSTIGRLASVALLAGGAFTLGCGGGGGDADAGIACGNNVVEAGEDCDDGNLVESDGCRVDCRFSCTVDADCNDNDACNGTETCNTALHRCHAGSDVLADGTECTTFALAPPSTDGGVADGGLVPMEVTGTCIAEACGPPCTMDPECDDGNVCTGTETCNMTYMACAHGVALNCNDASVCTIDSCDPTMGCVNTAIENDGDGHASPTVFPSCGDDCDDNDPDRHPDHFEVCGDGIDNNCSGDTTDEVPTTWYADCDADGFAASGAMSRVGCAKPATTAISTGCPNDSGDWTYLNPNTTATTDCADAVPDAHPGATEYHGNQVPGVGGYDWNCDFMWEQRYPNCTGTFCFFACFVGGTCPSTGSWGWDDGTAPSCGNYEYWDFCGDEDADALCLDDEWRQQTCR